MENFSLSFNFKDSGMAKIFKKNENILEKEKHILTRKYTLKNFKKIILKKLKN